jgi:hypothetical protein
MKSAAIVVLFPLMSVVMVSLCVTGEVSRAALGFVLTVTVLGILIVLKRRASSNR